MIATGEGVPGEETTLTRKSARELVSLMTRGEVSAREVAQAHIERIEKYNPVVNALVNENPELALREAAAADQKYVANEQLGPLHGIPLGVKDTSSTIGFPTTYGSRRFAHNIAASDDLHVARIRAAGAVRLGKTNVPEYAAGSHTFNELFGATRNPYDITRSAGGSSGGAAAALAAGFHPLADGSDMGGSLRNPAAFCGVVGMRPTPGVVPNGGVNVHSTLAVNGPLARDVEDLSLLLSVMSGSAQEDPLSFAAPIISPVVTPLPLSGLRLALSPTLGGLISVEAEIDDALRTVAKVLDKEGALVQESTPRGLADSVRAFRTLRAAEFYARLGPDHESGRETFVDFLAENIEQGKSLTAKDVIRAQQSHTRVMHLATRFFENFDYLLSPTTSVLPFPVELRYPAVEKPADGDYLAWMTACFALTPLGVPSVSLPVGFSSTGLPIGIQITGPARSDNAVLSCALAISHLVPTAKTWPVLAGSTS